MSTYIKNQEGGYTLKQLKSLSFEEVKKIFEATMRKVQSFVLMDSELEVQRLKIECQDIVEEPAKRQRTREASGSVQEQTGEEPKAEELSQEQLHQMMMVIPVEEVYVEALQKFNRDDLDKLWNLVKERFRTTEPTEDKARELWVELQRLFEPDDNDTLWKLQRYMHDPLNWWLYDTCGVHHVSTERGHDIYMLVKKDYPLTKAIMTLMLCNKLRVDQYSDMAEELLKKIFILVERPRHPAKPILKTTQDITNSTNQFVLPEENMDLPPRDQRHQYLRMLMEHRDAQGDPILRLCHRLIACSIAGRSQAPEKGLTVIVLALLVINMAELDAPVIDEGGQADQAPVHAPPLPPPPAADGLCQNRAGVTYTSYSQTPREYQRRRVRQRTGEASTSTAQQDQQQPDP
ncbi:hypothetical protein Tco_0869663 [Tanacetum coccineum]